MNTIRLNEAAMRLVGLRPELITDVSATRVLTKSQNRFCTEDLTREPKGPYVIYRFWSLRQESKYYTPWEVSKELLEDNIRAVYIGQTRQFWASRINQHLAAANADSPYLSHRELRINDGIDCVDLVRIGLTEQEADAEEERLVAEQSLYPYGLNMIPGGKAGLRWLAKRGCSLKRKHRGMPWVGLKAAMQKDAALANAISRRLSDESLTRLICAKSTTFSESEVREIRLLSNLGRDVSDISDLVGASESRVASVISENTYRFVA